MVHNFKKMPQITWTGKNFYSIDQKNTYDPPKSTKNNLCSSSYVNRVTPNCGDDLNTRAVWKERFLLIVNLDTSVNMIPHIKSQNKLRDHIIDIHMCNQKTRSNDNIYWVPWLDTFFMTKNERMNFYYDFMD